MPSPVCLAPTKSISTSAVGEYSSDGLPSRLRLAPTKNISTSAVGGHRADCLPQRTEREKRWQKEIAEPSVPCYGEDERENERVGTICSDEKHLGIRCRRASRRLPDVKNRKRQRLGEKHLAFGSLL